MVGKYKDFKTITKDDLKQMMKTKQNLMLIDVLSSDSYHKSHIPGAKNIPLGPDFETGIKRLLPDKEQPIVVYCAKYECQASPTAARKLLRMGYTDVSDYAGGLKEWTDSGYPLQGDA